MAGTEIERGPFRDFNTADAERVASNEEAIYGRLPSVRTKAMPKYCQILALLNTFLSFLLLFILCRVRPISEAVKMSRVTDFTSLQAILSPSISTTFEDQLRYNATSHEFWRDLDPSATKYFGLPSPEIDSAWAKLLLGEFPAVSEDELHLNSQLKFEEGDRNPRTGQFHIALDVFHSLHCLNAVRKEIDKDYYSQKIDSKHHKLWSAESQRTHMDHCLNHIRQSLQCHPDLSPAAMRKEVTATGEVFFLGNSEKHTCIHWEEIRRWIDMRRRSPLGAWQE